MSARATLNGAPHPRRPGRARAPWRWLALAVLVTGPAAGQGAAPGCLPWGDQHTINARLQGPGDVAVLCQNAVFELTGPVVFTADGQQLHTEGFPTDGRRALLRLASPDATTAIVASDRSDVLIANRIVDGNRPQLGARAGR